MVLGNKFYSGLHERRDEHVQDYIINKVDNQATAYTAGDIFVLRTTPGEEVGDILHDDNAGFSLVP